MKILDDYLNLRKEIYEYFKYEEEWHDMTIDDCRNFYWRIDDNVIEFHKNKEKLNNESDNVYDAVVQAGGVYKGKDFTMVCVDPQLDGNTFLQIYDNTKEIK